MQAFASIILLASVLVNAAPNPTPHDIVNLDNGVSTVPVSLLERSASPLVARKDSYPNCKGSSRCSNDQGFKNACAAANERVQPTIYKSGGDRSGVCSGHCGLFVQGEDCEVTGIQLTEAYKDLLNYGCQTCGSVQVGDNCIITVNYVGSC